MNIIEHRITPVTRYLLTRVSDAGDDIQNVFLGWFDDEGTARRAMAALAGVEQYAPRELDGRGMRGEDGTYKFTFGTPGPESAANVASSPDYNPEDDFPLTINCDRDPGDEVAESALDARNRLLRRRRELFAELNEIEARCRLVRYAGYSQEFGTSDRRQAAFEAKMREDEGA